MMKKFLALLMMVMTLMMGGTAMAEAPFEGVWVQFDLGFEILMPGDWLDIEVTEEMLGNGVFFAGCSADGANSVQISWTELGTAMTTQDIQATLAASYANVTVIEFNGVEFVSFVDESTDTFGMTALDGNGLGVYTFWFNPNSDEAFVETAIAIATSIRNIE